MPKIMLDQGLKITTFEPPPRGFNPLTATQAELGKHGFPPRLPNHLERYRRVWGHLKNKFHYIQPTFRVNREVFHGPRKRVVTEGTETSPNWSGGIVYAPSGQSFKWIEGDWVVPNVEAPMPDIWYHCANWIGIDGDVSNDVCQAGVACNVFRSGTSITRVIYPWSEWYPAPEVQITNVRSGAWR
jgi:hypothetical protein